MDAGGEAEMDFNTTEERQEHLIDSITILLRARHRTVVVNSFQALLILI